MDNTLERPPEDRWPVLRVAFSWLGFVNNGVLVFFMNIWEFVVESVEHVIVCVETFGCC